MRKKQFFIGVWCVILLGSCQVNQQGDNNIVIDVDDDFKLTFLEDLRTPADDLLFTLESIRNRECEADTVTMDLNHLASAIAINIDVLNTSASCTPGTSRISTNTSTDELLKDRMTLSIKLEALIANQGDIIVGDESIDIRMETTYGFYLPYESMQRVPDNLVWGYLGFTNESRPGAQEFIDRLNTLTTVADIGEGQYGYFELSNATDLTVLEEQNTTKATQPFLRNFELGDARQIEALFNEIKERYPSLEMVLRDSYGKILR